MGEVSPLVTRLVSVEQIAAIWEAHGLGAVERASATTSGIRNECYIVNDELVVRFNTQDPGFAKFANEAAAFALLAKSDVRVPSVIVLDASRTLVPYDFIVVTRLPGINVAEGRDDLSPEAACRVAHEAGRSLASLHGITFDGFGKLRELGDRPFPSWFAYFDDYVRRYVDAARRTSLLDDAVLSQLRAIPQRAADLLATVARGSLVHSDFHYENILQENGRLSAILDFEWALSGDPSYDFMAADVREEMLPGSEAVFLNGYRSVRPLDDRHDRRLELYQLFRSLETAVQFEAQGNHGGVSSALAETMRRLEAVEQRLGPQAS